MDIPPLRNGIRRASYDPELEGGTVCIIVTEDCPVHLLPVDSGLEIEKDPKIQGLYRAVRRRPRPVVV